MISPPPLYERDRREPEGAKIKGQRERAWMQGDKELRRRQYLWYGDDRGDEGNEADGCFPPVPQ
jgi:hypothetical protein